MIVERVTGNDASVLPVKQKYISELTDEDIYTFVTLRDCEFAVRKGSLTPVHEGYTLADAQGRLNMYPRLIRDNKGSLIHLLTNTTCPYRRNGTRLPYGSGELAGVIVHERFPQYEYVDKGGRSGQRHHRLLPDPATCPFADIRLPKTARRASRRR